MDLTILEPTLETNSIAHFASLQVALEHRSWTSAIIDYDVL